MTSAAGAKPGWSRANVAGGSTSPLARLYQHLDAEPWAALQLPGPLRRFITAADLTDEQMLAMGAGLALGWGAVPVVGMLGGIGHSMVVVGFLVAAPLVVVLRVSGRRQRRLVAALPDMIDLLGRAMRSGASLTQALREGVTDAPPILAAELRSIVADLDIGATLPDALRSWSSRNSVLDDGRATVLPPTETRIVAAALAIASENEAGAGQALAGVGQSLRDRRSLIAEIRSHTAQATASMQAMVWLPVALLVLDALGDQRRLRYLTTEPLGRACLVASVVLTASGWLWMRALVQRRLPT